MFPDKSVLKELKPADVRETIHRSLRRLGVEQVDMIQFHWWEYDVPGYIEALYELQKLQKEGKISQLSLTNFDTPRTREIVEAGIPRLQYAGPVLPVRPQSGKGNAEIAAMKMI